MTMTGDYKPTMSFEDRVEAWTLMQDALHELTPEQVGILSFHGVGGIGKTALREHFEQKLRAEMDVRVGQLAFTELGPFTPDKALADLRTSLGKQGDIRFPAFDYGYVEYLRQQYPERPPKDLQNWLQVNNSILREAINIIPGGGLAVEVANWLSAKLHDTWAKRAHQTLQSLYDKNGNPISSGEILVLLPQLLGEDLVAHCRDHPETRIVLIVDEYERLWPRESAGHRDHPVDDALQTLARYADGVLLVFFSRYPLHWGRRNRAWKRLLDGHLHHLNGLPADAADLVLRKERHPVTEEEIRRAMIESATDSDGKVYPFFLELQMKHYVELQRYGDVPRPEDFRLDAEDFDGRRRELIKRFMRDYPRDVEASLRHLAVARWFDMPLFEALDARFHIGGLPALDQVRDFSFVDISDDGRWRFTPSLWREAIVEDLARSVENQIHAFLFEYFSTRTVPPSPREITEAHCESLQEAAYHLYESDPSRLKSWFGETSGPFYIADRLDALVPALELIVRLAERNERPGTEGLEEPRYDLAIVLARLGRVAEAERLLESVTVSLDTAAAGSSEDTLLLRALSRLAILYIRRDDLETAEKLVERAAARAFAKERTAPLDSFTEGLVRATQADVLERRDRYAEAQGYRRAVLERTVESEGWNSRNAHAALHELGRSLAALGRLNEAEATLTRVALWCREHLGHEHSDSRIAMSNLADVLRIQGRTRSAFVLIEEALPAGESVPHLAKRPTMLRMQLGRAKILRDYGKLDAAEAYFRHELATKTTLFDEHSLPRCRARADFAALLAMRGDLSAAEDAYREALLHLERHPSAAASEIGRIKNRFGELLTRMGRFDEADRVLNEAEEALLRGAGPDHYRVGRCLTNRIRLGEAQQCTGDTAALRTRVEEIHRACDFNLRLRKREWQPVDASAVDGLLQKIAFEPLTVADLGDVTVELAPLEDLYSAKATLLRFTFAGTDPAARKFALLSGEHFALLDGTGAPIHAFNTAVGLNLTDENVDRYLWFFCEALLAGAGVKFLITERAEDIDWRADAIAAKREETGLHLYTPVVSREARKEEEPPAWRACAPVVYADALFHAHFRVGTDGNVQMTDAHVLAAELPVASFMRGLPTHFESLHAASTEPAADT